jgi:hypothetical protein
MPILIDEKGTQYTSADPQQIYNALKSGSYKLLPDSNLYVKDANNETWQLNNQNGDINHQLIATFENGGRFETKDEAFTRMYPELSGVSGDVLAGVSSAANSALFGIPAAAISGTKGAELFSSLRNTHPISSMIGDVAGVVSNVTPAGFVANTAGKIAGSAAIGAGKIASMAAEGAAMGALSSVPLAVTEEALGSPGTAAEHFIGTVGGGALIGAIASPLLGVAVPKAAELFGLTTKKSTELVNSGINIGTSKVADMTPEQKALFDNLTKDPEARQMALKLTKDVEESTIKSTVDDLTNLNKIIKEDVKGIYDTKFENIVQNLPKEDVLKAKQEMLDLIKQAKETMRLNPESYDSTFLKSLTAAEKTLDVRGAVNIETRKTMEEALKKLSPDKFNEIERGFDIAKAKAIKEARTEIGYKAPFDAAKIGIDRTGTLANDLYSKMSEVTSRLYGSEFVKISDTYAAAKDVLDNVKKLAFNSDGTVNYNKVKSMIGENKASQLKLDDLLSKVQDLSQLSGKEYNFGSQLDNTLKNIRTKQLLRSMGKDRLATTGDVALGVSGATAASMIGLPAAIGIAGVGLYRTLHNPRAALGLMNFLQNSQVRTANAINKIASFGAENKTAITKAYSVGKESFKSTKAEIIKDIQTYQMYSSPDSINQGFKSNFGILDKVAPQVSASIKAKSIDISNFLAKKAPQYSEDPITGEIKISGSTQKLNEYMIYKNAINNPVDAIKEINNGINVALNREAIQAIYPSLWSQYVQAKLQSVHGKDLSMDEKRQLNFILDLDNKDFTLPVVINGVVNPIEGNVPPVKPKPVTSPSKVSGNTSRIQRP